VYGERGCPACHSIDGLGGTIGPDLVRASAGRDVYGIMAALWNHLPAMAAKMDELGIRRPRLGAREAGDLVAFLTFLGTEPGAGAVDAGRRVFETRGCIRCHRVGDRGGVIGPALDASAATRTPVGLATGLWNHAPVMFRRMREMGIEPPELDARDIENLVAYLVATDSAVPRIEARAWILPGRPESGRAVVEEKECASCHSIAGRGAGTAPDLAAAARGRGVEAFVAAMWNKGPRMRAAFAARGEEPPRFEPAEMADVVAYLQSLGYLSGGGSAERGRRSLGEAGCLRCHGWGTAGAAGGDLRRAGPYGSFADRIAALWNHVDVSGRTDLPAGGWPGLDRSEMTDLLEFLGTIPR
jgi:mono/diheme cytochrome c family protein